MPRSIDKLGHPLNDSTRTLAFHLVGRVGAEDFTAWMRRHSAKLGVEFAIRQNLPHLVAIEATGAAEMVEAFALACSLGPQSVFVEELVVLDATRTEKQSQQT